MSIAAIGLAAGPVCAQTAPPSERLELRAASAATWISEGKNIVLLHGPVTIALDRAELTADDAVVWLGADDSDDPNIQVARIALVGHARLDQPGVRRSGDKLFVTDRVRGDKIRIVAADRAARDESASQLFLDADGLRKADQAALPAPQASTTSPSAASASTRPTRPPATRRAVELPVAFEAHDIESLKGDDGNIVIVLHGGVRLFQHREPDDLIELSSDSAVLYTPLKSLKELTQGNGKKHGSELILAAYLEGDVRIDFSTIRKGVPEQRLNANRVYYEFATDRAILTDAIIHTIEPQRGTPIILRAKTVRQLSNGEFVTDQALLTNSYFAVPTFAMAAQRMYTREEPTGDPLVGDRIVYDSDNITLQAFDVPFFYWPHAAGSMTEHGFPLRGIGAGHDSDYGEFFRSAWGLFETMGQIPPRDLDANFRLDYFSERGPGAGLNAAYAGGLVSDTTKQPWEFEGQFQSYFIYDKGEDILGAYRRNGRIDDPAALRGQMLYEHQHLFPDDWTAQVRLGWVSDATFMEQWFRRQFEQDQPRDISGYLKHQAGDEAFTIGVTYQPNRLVTTSGQQQEQFEVEQLPEIGYYREGDSLLGDHATLFSENQFSGEHFARSRASLADQGFFPNVEPGIPSAGYTGLTNAVVWRGDFRQQLDFPFTAGPIRVDPYLVGRYTEYSNSPQDDVRNRLLGGGGVKFTTQLWKADPTFENEFLDLHQLRHVITPEINLFASAMTVQQSQVYVFDPQTDAINDIAAAQIALHQRWETKRGGPADWRTVDVFNLNIEVDMFANKPPRQYMNPYNFRGLFFASYPEESIPRDALNMDANWRLSDNTIILGDMSMNLDRGSLQTLALGILVRRDARLSYYAGNRYIADLGSNITSVNFTYEVGPKYLISADQEFDFTLGKNVYSSMAVIRRFDTIYMAVRYFFDETTKQSGFSFNLYPAGFGQGLDTGAFNTFRR